MQGAVCSTGSNSKGTRGSALMNNTLLYITYAYGAAIRALLWSCALRLVVGSVVLMWQQTREMAKLGKGMGK